MAVGENVSRVETEFNLYWAEANPLLFVKGVREFKRTYPTESWRHHVDMGGAAKFVLIAVRRDAPYDPLSADYLKEIGLD
jgi:hypothetical protein